MTASDRDTARQATAIMQDACADGEHIYMNGWHDGLSRCACGKLHPQHLPPEGKATA